MQNNNWQTNKTPIWPRIEKLHTKPKQTYRHKWIAVRFGLLHAERGKNTLYTVLYLFILYTLISIGNSRHVLCLLCCVSVFVIHISNNMLCTRAIAYYLKKKRVHKDWTTRFTRYCAMCAFWARAATLSTRCDRVFFSYAICNVVNATKVDGVTILITFYAVYKKNTRCCLCLCRRIRSACALREWFGVKVVIGGDCDYVVARRCNAYCSCRCCCRVHRDVCMLIRCEKNDRRWRA